MTRTRIFKNGVFSCYVFARLFYYLLLPAFSAFGITGCGHSAGITPFAVSQSQSSTHKVHALDDGGDTDGSEQCDDNYVWDPYTQECVSAYVNATPTPVPAPTNTPEDLCDEFPGSCDGPPAGGGNGYGGGGDGEVVAIAPGTPAPGQPCSQVDGTNSIPVGGTLGYANINGQQEARSVKDINQLFGFGSSNIVNGNVMYDNLQPIGWLYEDNNGAFWFQKDPNAQWSMSLSGGVTLGGIVSAGLGITPPTGQTAVSVGSTPGSLAQNEAASPCWSQGGQFYPAEIVT